MVMHVDMRRLFEYKIQDKHILWCVILREEDENFLRFTVYSFAMLLCSVCKQESREFRQTAKRRTLSRIFNVLLTDA